MQPPADDLQARLMDISAQLDAVRAERKKLKRRRIAWDLGGQHRNAVKILYYLADGIHVPIIAYLRKLKQAHRWPDRDNAQLDLLILDIYLASDDAEVLALVDDFEPMDPAAYKIARACFVEWSVAEWTKCSNERDVVPSTAHVLDEFEMRRRRLPEAVRPPVWGLSSAAAARKRMTRWRRRWGGRIGRLQLRADLPVGVMTSKAILLHRANRAHVTYDDLTCGFMLPAPVETRHHILEARVGRGVLESLSRAGELVCFIGAFMC